MNEDFREDLKKACEVMQKGGKKNRHNDSTDKFHIHYSHNSIL